MGKFKRFCMIVFVVAAVLGIGVLAALWFAWEPLFPAIAWLMSMPWFFVVEAVLLGITALGLLVVLIRAITAPGKNSQLELERDNGSIAITQNAIQSTVKHVVESHHGLSTDNVKVHITNKHDPRMSIHAKIDPGRNAELGQLGAKLQDEIAATLEAFTGYPVDSVRITFAGDADVVTPASTMRIHPAATPAPKSAPKQSQAAKQKPKTTNAYASSNQKHDEQKAPQRTADTPSDVLANAAAETKRDKGVYASMKRAFSPYVENHSHAVLYGIIGFVAAALILIVGFWPTVLLAVFAAIGVVIGKYRDGDRKTRQQMKQVLERFN